jgi:hypothetical protein
VLSSAHLFYHRDLKDYTQEDWVEYLKTAESLGGSAGLKRFYESPQWQPPPQIFGQSLDAELSAGIQGFLATVRVRTADGHEGSGRGYGRGTGGVAKGVLQYNDWTQLESVVNRFILSGWPTTVCDFYIGQELVARFEGTGLLLGTISAQGSEFLWNLQR